jgi:1,2-diacylglycerol 3-beta-glucosyltransferase
MNNPFDITLLVLAGIMALPGIYLLVLTAAALTKNQASEPCFEESRQKSRIAVIISAHDEENMIGTTVATLFQSQYARELTGVFVIADNCSDETAQVAQSAGATVWERFDTSKRGKGQALDWALKNHKDKLETYDIISILDADTLAHRLYLSEIDQAFRQNEIKAVQGYYGTSNISSGWRPALSEAAFAVSHHLRPLGRNALGSTAGLKGNGMAFRSDLLLETGWPAHSLVEDLEFTLLLLERGINVHYIPEARVAAEMVTNAAAATTQRIRWEGGRGQVLRSFGPRLLRQIKIGNRWAALEALCDLLFPPMVLLVLPCLLLLVISLLLGAYLAAIIAATALAIVPVHLSLALLHRGVPGKVWKSLLSVPLFILWKIPIYLKIASKGAGNTWLRTRRENEITSVEIGSKKSVYARAASSNQEIGDSVFEQWRKKRQTRNRFWRSHLRRIEVLKRALDIVAGTTALLLLSPLLLLTALLIWLEDHGPIFFRQERIGRYGVPFQMLKFRSMRTDAEQLRRKLDEQNEHKVAVTFKIKKDPRITRIGRFIRKFSIDEMPQFINVLRGEMSMVGPRPALAREVALYESFQLRRLNAKPGISCLWQVNGRSNIDFEGQVRLDLEYIHSESIWKDIIILLKTVPAVILARGAY